MTQHFKRGRALGFTIVELLIVIVVVGILAALVAVGYNGIVSGARDKSVLSDMNGVDAEVARYATKNSGADLTSLAWFSPNATNANIKFTPTEGNVVDVVVSGTNYCIRIYNPSSKTYPKLANAYKKGSSATACDSIPPSSAAYTYSGETPSTPPVNTFTTFAWTQLTSAGSRAWTDIDVSADGTKMAAVVNNGYIYTSADSGATWTERTSSGALAWSEIAISDDGTKLVARANQGVYNSTNSGATWTVRLTTSTFGYWALAASADGNTAIVGSTLDDDEVASGYIRTSTNAGTSWVRRDAAGAPNTFAAGISDDGTKMLSLNKYGDVMRSTNGGVSWSTSSASSPGVSVWGRMFAGSSDLSRSIGSAISAGAPGVYHAFASTNTGTTWSIIPGLSSIPTFYATMSSDGKVQYATAQNTGSLYASLDFGATWNAKPEAGSRTWGPIATNSDGSVVVSLYSGTGYIFKGVYQ